MSPITFKFFSPRGDCRRVTYDDVPEFGIIKDLVNNMVEGPHCLSYRDSEGDVVLLKSSRDVLEAVNDAKDSGAKSIKVQIRLVRDCPRNNDAKATTNNRGNNRNHCGGGAGRRANCHRWGGPHWGRCWSQGLFGHPRHVSVDFEGVSDEVEELFKNFAPFFGIHIKSNGTDEANEKASKESAEEPAGSKNHPPKENEHHPAAKDTAEQVDETPKPEGVKTTPVEEAASPKPTIEESDVAGNSEVSSTGFTFIENELQDGETETAGAPEENKGQEQDDDEGKLDFVMDDKLKLLKEMGFELPENVARNMIRELNGRMDLIVRALVANQK